MEKLYSRGTNIRILSGDNIETAKYAARNADILKGDEKKIDKVVMEASKFREIIGGIKKTIDKNGNEKNEIMNK